MEILYRHAKNFVAGKDETKQALRGICFTGESAVMCNRHLIFILKDYPAPKRIAEPKTGQEILDEYPSVWNVIPEKFLTQITFRQYLAQWQDCFRICADVTKGIDAHNCIQMLLDGAGLKVQARNSDREMTMDCILPAEKITECETLKRYYNAKYLLNILAIFKDLGGPTLQMKVAEKITVFESERAVAAVFGIEPSSAENRYGYAAN